MSTEVKTRDGKSFETCIEIVDSRLVKNREHNKYCAIHKDISRKCYFYAIYSYLEDVLYILSESKLLSTLDSHIDEEHDELYIKIVLDNAENDGTFYYKNGENRPESRNYPIGTKTNQGVIIAKNDNFYYLKRENSKRNNGIEEKDGTYSYIVLHWHDVFDISKFSHHQLYYDDSIIRYYNTTIDALYGKEWHFGVDRNPSYQRGDVWTNEQKEALIDSIFNGIPIGAIIFAKRDWEDRCDEGEYVAMEEIVDGRQRYTTIIDFVCDRFRYRGKLYSELHPFNRNRFDSTQIMLGQMEFNGRRYDEKQVLQTFVRLNIGGTSMDKKFIEEAKKRLEENQCMA